MTRAASAAASGRTAGSTTRPPSRQTTCMPSYMLSGSARSRAPPAAAPTRVVIAVGEESMGTITGRTSLATANLLGQQATVFPSHHGGFMGGEFGHPGQPEAFARKLRDVLDGES